VCGASIDWKIDRRSRDGGGRASSITGEDVARSLAFFPLPLLQKSNGDGNVSLFQRRLDLEHPSRRWL